LLCVGTRPTRADGVSADGGGQVARAGASAVRDDGGTALLVNPGTLARRSATRLQLATAVRDESLRFCADACTAGSAPAIENRGAPIALATVGIVHGGDAFTAGVVYSETGRPALATHEPAFNQPVDEVMRGYPHRYAGTAFALARRTVGLGAAYRVASWLAAGASLAATRIELAEARHVWAGYDGINPIGDPGRDLRVALAGADSVVPSAHAGVLIAPPWPVELGLAASYEDTATVAGTASLTATRDVPYPAPVTAASTGALRLPATLRARAAARYLGPRFTLEAGAELCAFVRGDTAPSWMVALQVQDQDSVPAVDFTRVPSALGLRDHMTARATADFEIVRDFLWLSIGYRYRTAAVPRTRLSTGFADLAGHTLAFGVEGYYRDITVTIGYSRSLATTADVTAAETEVTLVNPLGGGTMPVGAGRYELARNAFGILVEVAWDSDASGS
jgi:hypothetical protein